VRNPRTLVAALLLCAPISAASAGSLSTEIDGVRVELGSEPVTPGTKQATIYRVRLAGSGGEPLTGVRVTLQGRMADGMSVVAPLRTSDQPGIYRGQVLFTMEGRWELTLRITGQGKRFELQLTEQVGR